MELAVIKAVNQVKKLYRSCRLFMTRRPDLRVWYFVYFNHKYRKAADWRYLFCVNAKDKWFMVSDMLNFLNYASFPSIIYSFPHLLISSFTPSPISTLLYFLIYSFSTSQITKSHQHHITRAFPYNFCYIRKKI